MAYELRSRKGLQIKKDGNPVFAADTIEVKIEELDEKDKSFIAVASTEHEDRDKDIVRQDGWKLANFNKNPVIPWSHNYYGVPIAKSLKTWVDKSDRKGSRLLFKPKFDQDDEESMKIFNKYKNGFLTSFSVGFQGIKFNYRNEDDPWWGGREFTEQELLEISAVAVPANPHATTRLNYAGIEKPNNLIQMGYPEIFAKTKTGLFYPVTDIAVYTNPKSIEIENGVIGIKAMSLLDNEQTSDPVAYLFDPELFDDKSVNEWISKNANKKWKTKYIDIKFTDSEMFSLSSLETEDTIKEFKNSIDLSESDLSIEIEGQEEKVSDSVSDNGIENDNEVKETDSGSTDDKGSSDGIENEVSDTSDEKSESLEDNTDLDSVEQVQNAITFPVKNFIEVTTIIKDFDGKVLDQHVSVIASNKEFKTALEFVENKDKDPISLLKEEMSELKKSIDKLCNEKIVANVSEISDNADNLNDDEFKNSESTNEEIIELDESLIKSPGIDDKTDSNDQIEIDPEFLNKSSNNLKEITKESLLEKMRCNLKEALIAASGKID